MRGDDAAARALSARLHSAARASLASKGLGAANLLIVAWLTPIGRLYHTIPKEDSKERLVCGGRGERTLPGP